MVTPLHHDEIAGIHHLEVNPGEDIYTQFDLCLGVGILRVVPIIIRISLIRLRMKRKAQSGTAAVEKLNRGIGKWENGSDRKK